MLTPLAHLNDLIDQYPETGKAGIALALDNKSVAVLDKELSASSQKTHKLGFFDVMKIIRMSQKHGADIEPLLDSFVSQFGYRLAGQVEGQGAVDLDVLAADAGRKAGDASFVVVVANSDGHICENDRKAGKKRIREAKDALRILDRELDAKYEQDKRARGLQ